MDPKLMQKWSQQMHSEALKRFDAIADSNVDQILSSSESLIYEFENPQGKQILRVTPKSHRNVAQIRAELLWQDELSKNGIRVLAPNHSVSEVLIEDIGDFLVCSFPFVEGEDFWKYKLGFEEFALKAWAQTIARMHRDGQPKSDLIVPNRPSWETEREWELVKSMEDKALTDATNHLREYLSSLPKQDYGLIHADLHHSNVLMNSNGEFYAIDFDDCASSWHLYDLAVIYNMFDIISRNNQGKHRLHEDWELFVKYYLEINPLDKFWWEQLERFNAFRYFHLIGFLKRSDAIQVGLEGMNRYIQYKDRFLSVFLV